jgi:hypothetical protein
MPQKESTLHLASVFYHLGPMCYAVSQLTDPEPLVALCKQPLVKQTTQRLLQHLVSFSMRIAPRRIEYDAVHVNARVFLSAYMMLFFPDDAMDPAADASKIVRSHAAVVVQRLEQIIYALSTRASLDAVPMTLTQGFHILLANYNQAFAAWRAHDAERLIAKLGTTLQSAKASEIPPHDIETMRDRVRILGGQAALDRIDCVVNEK